jgi:sigma-B regulation protein RsbU (phosphoserine phosphatase)
MQNEIQTIEQLSQQLGEIIFGTFFLLIGLISVAIALLRREIGVQILIWLGVWTGFYGTRLLIVSSAVRMTLPNFIQNSIATIDVTIGYLILVFALLTWLNLTRGKIRIYLKVMIFVGLLDGFAGIVWFLVTGKLSVFILLNNLIAASTLVIFAIVFSIKELSNKFLFLPNRGVLAIGTFLFISEALYSNLSRFFGYQTYPITGWLGFAVLLLSLAYVAAKMIFVNERRLITIENEMETARQIQTSILPEKVPELNNLNITAAYYPMTSVAGDFYDFIEINKNESGFLVADVSGHGVPAALIASMIKIAMQSVQNLAKNPDAVLQKLGKILGNQLHGQFVTAAYLYINSEICRARYSAAGHPPMLYWNSVTEKVESIESNGLPIGVLEEISYPVFEFAFNRSDRFLIYTDGVTEAKNLSGNEFGNERLNKLIKLNKSVNAEEFSKIIFNELKLWQDKKLSQQDDITWIIIDSK